MIRFSCFVLIGDRLVLSYGCTPIWERRTNAQRNASDSAWIETQIHACIFLLVFCCSLSRWKIDRWIWFFRNECRWFNRCWSIIEQRRWTFTIKYVPQDEYFKRFELILGRSSENAKRIKNVQEKFVNSQVCFSSTRIELIFSKNQQPDFFSLVVDRIYKKKVEP